MVVVAYICPDQDVAYLCEQISFYLVYGITLVADKVNSFYTTPTSTEVICSVSVIKHAILLHAAIFSLYLRFVCHHITG